MKTIILDFDGTIGDTQALIVKTLQQTMQTLNLPIQPKDDCAKTIGLPLAEAFRVLCSLSEAESERCAETYRDLFETNKQYIVVQPFPHVIDTIRQLHRDGYLIAVASSRNRSSLLGYLKQLDIEACVSCVVAANDVTHAKPAPEMVLKVLEQLDSAPTDALVVGDMTYDVDMGRNAGTLTCGVTYGNGTREQLVNADYVIDDFAELLPIVAALSKDE